MAEKYTLLVGGAELELDIRTQWVAEDREAVLRRAIPVTWRLKRGGNVTFMPGPGVAIKMEQDAE